MGEEERWSDGVVVESGRATLGFIAAVRFWVEERCTLSG